MRGRPRRRLGLAAVAALAMTGAAACSDDGSQADLTTTERPSSETSAAPDSTARSTAATTAATIAASSSSAAPATEAPPSTTDSSSAELTVKLDAAVEQAMEELEVSGAVVGISIPGTIEYDQAFGTSDTATGEPMSLEDHIRIGSVTKTFTGTAILQLVDQGLIQLSDPISKYVAGVPRGDEITLRMLGDMRSGIFPYTDDQEWQARYQTPTSSGTYEGPPAYTPQELVAASIKHPLNFEPNTAYEYSNTNTVLLGMVVEQISGQALGDYFAQHIYPKAGLSQTSLPSGTDMPAPYAHGYTKNTPTDQVADATHWDPSWAGAAGAMISTFADLELWAVSLGKGTLVSPEAQHERLRGETYPGGTVYGFTIFNEHGWIGHNGSLPGYTTVAVYLPDLDATLVVNATNDFPGADGANAAGRIARAVTSVVTPDHLYTIEGGR